MADANALIGGIATAAGGVVAAAVAVLGSRRLQKGQAEKEASSALVNEAQAEQVRVDTAIKASAAIEQLAGSNARLTAQNQRQQSAIERVVWSIEAHGRWDSMVKEILQQMRDALTAAGIAHGIPDVPEPPPIKVDIPSP